MDKNKKSLFNVIDSIYSAATTPDLWQVALQNIVESVRADFCIVCFRDKDVVNFDYGDTTIGDAGFLPDYEKYAEISPLVPILDNLPMGSYLSHEVLPQKDFWETQFYQEFCQKYKVEEGMGGPFIRRDNRVGHISLVRHHRNNHFTQHDTVTLSIIQTHLARAFIIQNQLARSKLEAEYNGKMFGHLAMGMIMLDAKANVVSVSEKAEQIIRSNSDLRIVNNQLQVRSTQQHQDLSRLIHRSIQVTACNGMNPGGALRISTKTEQGIHKYIEVLIMPYKANGVQREVLSRRVAAIVFINMEEHYLPMALILRQLYGLTTKEAEVCQLMLLQNSTEEIADVLSIGKPAVRYHYKNIKYKLGVRGQSELIQTLTRSLAGLTTEVGL